MSMGRGSVCRRRGRRPDRGGGRPARVDDPVYFERTATAAATGTGVTPVPLVYPVDLMRLGRRVPSMCRCADLGACLGLRKRFALACDAASRQSFGAVVIIARIFPFLLTSACELNTFGQSQGPEGTGTTNDGLTTAGTSTGSNLKECTWVRVDGAGGSVPRYDHSLTRTQDGALRMFGGVPGYEQPLHKSLHRYSSGQWIAEAEGPPGRRAHMAAYHEGKALLVIFGGEGAVTGSAPLGDTWTFDGVKWQDASQQGPPAGEGAAGAYHPDSGAIVLFGGFDEALVRKDETWTWNGVWSGPLAVLGPEARSGHRMALDEGTGKVMLFGGCKAAYCLKPEERLDDTWAWDGAQWQLLAPGTGTGPLQGTMAYHKAEGAMYRFDEGGNYRWNGSDWEQTAGVNPNVHGRFAAAYDPEAGGIVLFGGITDFLVATDETWIFRCEPAGC